MWWLRMRFFGGWPLARLVRGYADDTAVVVSQLGEAAVPLQELFQEFARVSGLQLNLAKTIVIPLGCETPGARRERQAALGDSWAVAAKWVGHGKIPRLHDRPEPRGAFLGQALGQIQMSSE